MERVGRQVRVLGHVQGVFFRAWAADEARSLGVAGWIRNAPDGSVEAYLEGERLAVSELVDLLREGPPGARVQRVHVEEADLEGNDGFNIRH